MSPFWQETRALTVRWFARQRKEMGSVIFGLTQPLVWLLLFGQMFERIASWQPQAFGTTSYLAFQTSGMVAFTILGNSIMGAVPFLFDRETGYINKLLVAPISRTSLLVSRFIFVTVFSSVQALVILGAATALGVRVATGFPGVLGLLVVGALLSFGFTAVSVMLAFVIPGHAAFFGIVSFLMTPALFLSNALMPLELMPAPMRLAAQLNPLTHAIDVMRPLMIGGLVPAQAARSVLCLIAFDVVLLGLAARIFRRKLE